MIGRPGGLSTVNSWAHGLVGLCDRHAHVDDRPDDTRRAIAG